MNAELLPAVEIDPSGPCRGSVIWLHGLGANGHDFEPVVPMFGLGPEHGLRFVFPHAPSIPVTINGGFVMPAWYDISEIDFHRRHDEVGIRRSADQLEAWIAAEKARGIPAERIVVAGFSQGGAIALHAGLRHAEKLAGILILSTYLVCQDSLEAERSEANFQTPIFQAHGTHDPMVVIQRGEESRDRLLELGYSVEWRSYPMEHAVCPEEIDDVGAWLRGVVRSQDK
ncbi:MAG: alpha/beta hydrolase [Planctomycetota bacterium]|jgi:phospholipase/carboxylesterase